MTIAWHTKSGFQLPFLWLAFAFIFTSSHAQNRDGKLLQGEKWQKFNTENTKADFFVSTSGNDQWSGTLSEPNVSILMALLPHCQGLRKQLKHLRQKFTSQKINLSKKDGSARLIRLGGGKDILVYIREGHYYLGKPLQFEPEDGGERVETNLPTGAFEYHKVKDHYVTYAAYPGEKPVISGCRPVTGWTQKKGVWSAHLEADTMSMFIVNGKKQVLARKPNTGYYIPTAVSKKTDEITFRKGELEPWKELAGNRIVMLLRWYTGINSINRLMPKTELLS